MKTAKRLVSLVAALVMVMSLVACGGEKGLVGTWEVSADIDGQEISAGYTFESNGDCSVNAMGITMDGTYKTDGDKITITVSFMGVETSQEGTYKVDGDTLTLTIDGETGTLKRK